MGNADPHANSSFQDWGAVTVRKASLLRRQMLVDELCCDYIDSGM